MKYYLYRYHNFPGCPKLKQVWGYGAWVYLRGDKPAQYFETRGEAEHHRWVHGLSDPKMPCRIGRTP